MNVGRGSCLEGQVPRPGTSARRRWDNRGPVQFRKGGGCQMSQGALCLILARSWGHRLALGSSGRLGLPGVKPGVSVPSHACRSCP